MLIKVGEGESVQEVEIGDVSDLMKNEEFAKQFQSSADSMISKAVDSYKEKGFKSAVDTAVEERIKAKETKTPEEIKLAKMQQTIDSLTTKGQEKELLEMKVKNAGVGRKALKDSGLPVELVDFFVNEDAEKSTANIAKAVEILTGFKTELTQGVLSENNTKVPGKTVIDANGELQEPGKGASKDDWVAYFKAKKSKK